MARYFEAVSDDAHIILDDTYRNLELLDITPLKGNYTKVVGDTTPAGTPIWYKLSKVPPTAKDLGADLIVRGISAGHVMAGLGPFSCGLGLMYQN